MLPRAAVMCALALVGCGRIGFDLSTSDSGTGGDAQGGPLNVVFATHNMYQGDLGGIAGADALCAQAATNAGLAGHFVAWLSTSAVKARDRLVIAGQSTTAHGWVRPDRAPVTDTVVDLLAETIAYPIRLDESGKDLATQDHTTLSGTTPDGTIDPAADQCNDWTASDTGHFYSVGDLARTTLDWSDYAINDCSSSGHIYCFEVDYATPLPAAPSLPPGARLAFVSTAPFAANGGRGAADTICANEAQKSGFPGTFLAMLAMTTATAASRFDPAPGPWYRVDRIALASTGAQLLDFSPLDVPLTTGPDGSRIALHVWTGAPDPNTLASAGDDCDDWSTVAATSMGHTGKSSSSTSGFEDGSVTCDQALPVYCFQQ